MQGYGLFAMEQLLHSPTGSLLTRGPGAYKEAKHSLNRTRLLIKLLLFQVQVFTHVMSPKIPSFNDVPAQFNVALLRGAANPRAVYSSKAVGEVSRLYM